MQLLYSMQVKINHVQIKLIFAVCVLVKYACMAFHACHSIVEAIHSDYSTEGLHQNVAAASWQRSLNESWVKHLRFNMM